jgi:hypothetical protein
MTPNLDGRTRTVMRKTPQSVLGRAYRIKYIASYALAIIIMVCYK